MASFMVMRPLALALMLFSFMRDTVTTALTTGDDTGEQKDNFLVELEGGKGKKGKRGQGKVKTLD